MMDQQTIIEKDQKLTEIIKPLGTVLVAFSGGVDSSFVLKKAIDVLGKYNVKGVIVKSELFREEEFNAARTLGKSLNVEIIETEIAELEDPYIIKTHLKVGITVSVYCMVSSNGYVTYIALIMC